MKNLRNQIVFIIAVTSIAMINRFIGLSWMEALIIKSSNITIEFHSHKLKPDYYSHFLEKTICKQNLVNS